MFSYKYYHLKVKNNWYLLNFIVSFKFWFNFSSDGNGAGVKRWEVKSPLSKSVSLLSGLSRADSYQFVCSHHVWLRCLGDTDQCNIPLCSRSAPEGFGL